MISAIAESINVKVFSFQSSWAFKTQGVVLFMLLKCHPCPTPRTTYRRLSQLPFSVTSHMPQIELYPIWTSIFRWVLKIFRCQNIPALFQKIGHFIFFGDIFWISLTHHSFNCILLDLCIDEVWECGFSGQIEIDCSHQSTLNTHHQHHPHIHSVNPSINQSHSANGTTFRPNKST